MNKYKILFVDDEEIVRQSLLRALFDTDYEIKTACNGKEALELVNENKFHLIISDYKMPVMDGIEFFKQARKISPETIRIILTGHADVNIAIAAINDGQIYKLIQKPWDPEILKIHVEKGLEYYNVVQERNLLNEKLIEKNNMLEDLNKNLEKLVEERTQQLLHSEKMATLGQLAAQIGHEINNVLTVLVGRVELLQSNLSNVEYIEKTIRILIEHLDRLRIQSRNLLTLGRSAPPKFEKVNIKMVLDKTIDDLLSVGILKYYKIEKDYMENVPLINGDKSQLQQVYTNLFINAHHAMENEREITVGIKTEGDHNRVTTYIRDTGHGIPEKNLEKIFDPFFTTKPLGKGTGLGLLVVKKIIDFHDGYININSKVNKGTTVTIGFPLIKENF